MNDRAARPRLGWAVRLMALGVLSAVLLLAGECAVRLASRPVPAPSAAPQQVDVVNRHGFHDLEHAREKPAGTFRVLCLGDSFVFARGIPYEASFCRAIAPLLESTAKRDGGATAVETIALALEGLGTAREVQLLESRKGLGYRPEVLVLGYVLNDPEDDTDPAAFKKLREPIQPRKPRGALAALVRASRLADAIYARLENTRRYAALERYYHALHDPASPGWMRAQAAFARLAELTRESGTKVLVAIFPLLDFPLDERYPFREPHARVAELAHGSGLEVLDLLPVYAPVAGPELVLLPGADPHPSAKGHAIAARAIADRIAALGWLQPSSAPP